MDAFTDADREEIRSRFATLKWTRVSLISAYSFRALEVSDMAEDVIDSRESILVYHGAFSDSHRFIFDPKAFQEENLDLNLTDYQMNESELY